MTESGSLVSVVIPTHNRRELVAQAIRSVLEESYADFEIIVVDDGSSDDTRAFFEGIADPRVRYFHQSNAGRSAARNTGVRMSRGRHIAFLDDDDLCLPGRLACQVAPLESQPEIGLVAGGWLCIDEHGCPMKETRPWRWRPVLDTQTWLFACPAMPGTVTVRKEWLEKVGGFDVEIGAHAEDWDLFLRLARAGCQMAWVEQIVSAYRVHSGNTVHNARRQRDGVLLVLNRFFADPGLPADLQALKDVVYSRAYLRGAAREYAAGLAEDASQDVERAVALDPCLLDDGGERLVDSLVGWVDDPVVSDPVQYVTAIFDHLPATATHIRYRRRYALGRAARQSLFGAHFRKDREDAIRSIGLLAVNDPGAIADRGVASVLAEAVLGRGITGAIRSLALRARVGTRG